MPLYKKSILRVGTYHSPDGTVQVTPERLQHWARMHRKLRRNRQVVPIDWDHADDPTTAIPMSASAFRQKKRSAKNTVGHLRDFRVAKDGKSAQIVLDIHRKNAAEAADANSVFVSPVIFERWNDGAGNKYEDVITHVDFVNHPVDASQGLFSPTETGSVALALRFGLDRGRPKVYRLELDVEDEEEDDDDLIVEEDDVADEDAGGELPDFLMEGGEDEEPGTDDFMPEDEDIIEMGDEDVLAGQEADDELAEQIRSDLIAAGIAAPEGVDPILDAKQFLGQLCAALRQKAMDDKGGEEGLGDEMDIMPEEGGGELMETSPEFAAMSLRLKRAEQRSSAAEQRLIRMARNQKTEALKGLLKTGRITANEFNTQCAALRTVKMSLGPDGEPKRTDLDAFIQARKAVPAGAMWPHNSELRMSLEDTVLETPGEGAVGVVSAAEAKKFVDEQAKRMGGMIATR